MASVVKNITSKNIRTFAAQAAVAHQQTNYSLPYHQPQVSKLPSGGVVASLENNSPIATVSILFKAGSRYESGPNVGVSHVVRACAGLSTQNHTTFKITRLVQQLGGSIASENGREHIRYTITINRDCLGTCLDLLANVATKPLFKQWELDEQVKLIGIELENRQPVALSIDMVHQVAFRTGLGNSIFVPDYNLKKLAHTSDLNEYHSSTHTVDGMAITGFGVDHKPLLDFAKTLKVGASSSAASGPSSYKGGDKRVEVGGSVSHVAVVGQGAKIGSEDSASLAVAQFLLGTQPGVKYGQSSSKLAGIVGQAGGSGSASAINCNYSDGGLFGFYLQESASQVGAVSQAIAKALRATKFTDKEVNIAKMRAKAAVTMGLESQATCVEDMTLQAAFTGSYQGQKDIVAALDKISSASVQKALSKAFNGRLSVGAIGGLSNLPYSDEM